MLIHYLQTAFKVHFRHKLFTLVNITGLGVGLACCFLITLYVRDELDFDRSIPLGERLYRVSSVAFPVDGSAGGSNAATTPLVGPLLEANLDDVEKSARLHPAGGLLRNGATAFYEKRIDFIDGAFFDLFPQHWLAGDLGQAMRQPDSIVLTQALAEKYFGGDDPMGRVLTFENTLPLTVTGVIGDLPENTHLSGAAFVTISSLPKLQEPMILDNWSHTSFHTYIRVKAGTDIDALQRQFPAFLDRYYSAGASKSVGLSLTKVGDIHLHSRYPFELKAPGSLKRLYVFAAISLCILTIAGINFMNLAMASATLRSREVGLRKSMGAGSAQIVFQLLGESLLLTVAAAVLALALVEVILPAFNQFTGKQLSAGLFGSLPVLGLHVLVIMAVALCAGIYPAVYQAAWNPSAIIRGRVKSGKGGKYFRNGIIVFQFVIAIVLIVATLVIYLQLDYADRFDQGYDDEQVLVLNGSSSEGIYAHWGALRRKLEALDGVVSVTASNQVPHEENGNTILAVAQGDPDGMRLPFMLIDFDFFRTYGIGLVAGRLFSRDFAGDVLTLPKADETDTPGNVILNMEAVREYGWTPRQAVGREFQIYHNGAFTRGMIIGVVRDSYFESVRSTIKPMVFMIPDTAVWKGIPSYDSVSVRINGGDVRDTLRDISRVWDEVVPEFPLQSRFLSADRRLQYQAETRQGRLVSYFTLLSLFIAGIGLFALASWNAAMRTREIGVRKVLGSSALRIVILLTMDFSHLVLLANLIAWPVAYFAMNRWLQNFAYRIDLTPMIFIGSGFIVLCIAWATVGGTAARAASQKPALALRYE